MAYYVSHLGLYNIPIYPAVVCLLSSLVVWVRKVSHYETETANKLTGFFFFKSEKNHFDLIFLGGGKGDAFLHAC